MTYMLHPGAEQDIAQALEFYSEQAGLLVAKRFLEEFERTTKILLKHPNLGMLTSKGRRTFPMKIFPYSVIYRKLETNILILIVRHQHRKPSFAGDRPYAPRGPRPEGNRGPRPQGDRPPFKRKRPDEE